MTSRLVNQMIPRFQISSWKIIFLCTLILLLTLFVNFFSSPQKFGHIMLHHPLKRQEKELQVSRLTAWPVYQEMSMKHTFK